jgi:putative oxidoreductase
MAALPAASLGGVVRRSATANAVADARSLSPTHSTEVLMLDSIKSPAVVIGRVLLALMFVLSGFGKLGNIAGTAGYIASSGLPAASTLAVLVGLFEVVAGLALAVGFKARWAALGLALFTLLASLLFHQFWAAPAAQQMMQQLMFMKNLAIAGGMFMVAALGAGPLAFDSRRAAT